MTRSKTNKDARDFLGIAQEVESMVHYERKTELEAVHAVEWKCELSDSEVDTLWHVLEKTPVEIEQIDRMSRAFADVD